MNLLARGTRPLRVIERQSHLAYPAGVVELLEDTPEEPDQTLIRSRPRRVQRTGPHRHRAVTHA